MKSHLQVRSKWGRIQMLYSKAGSKSTFITATWQVGFTSHQPVHALKPTGQNVFFVSLNQLWANCTEFKELSSHNYEQNVPQKDLVGEFHFSEILPKPKPLQKGLIHAIARSCKSEYQNVFPVRYGPVVVSLGLSINIAPLLSIFSISFCSRILEFLPQHLLRAHVFHILSVLTWDKLTGTTRNFCALAHSVRDWCFS